jgi:hypothetical protein
VTLDSKLALAGKVLEAVVVALLIYRRAWRNLPLFFAYSIWSLLSGCTNDLVMHYAPKAYFNTYFINNIIDSVLQFCVLVEVAWSVFRPFRASLPRQTVWILGLFLVIAGAAVWPFAKAPAFAHLPLQWQYMGRFEQTDAILRVLIFLILAGCSQLLSIGWRDRELQIATGMGFYSLVALAITALQAYLGVAQQNHLQHFKQLDQFLVASYIGSLAYWSYSFAQKTAERREFSPQMQGMLLAVAGAARGTRIALTGSSSGKSRSGRDL